jgi:hypothetical protein
MLDAAGDRVQVVRIERTGNANSVAVLKTDEVVKLWVDPALRTSNVLSSLFHEAAVICEGETDARFFRAMIEAVHVDERQPDIQFYHFGGKGKISSIVTSLRAIKVPVVVVVDIDVLNDKSLFSTLLESLGGTFANIANDVRLVVERANMRKGQLSGQELSVELDKISERLRGKTAVPPEVREALSSLTKESSNWQRLKEDGYRGLVDAEAIQAFERIAAVSSDVGLLINPEGELEGFCRQIGRKRKAEWLAEVLKRDLKNDPTIGEARQFVDSLRSRVKAAISQHA